MFYDLERIWRDGENIDIAVLERNKEKNADLKNRFTVFQVNFLPKNKLILTSSYGIHQLLFR